MPVAMDFFITMPVAMDFFIAKFKGPTKDFPSSFY